MTWTIEQSLIIFDSPFSILGREHQLRSGAFPRERWRASVIADKTKPKIEFWT